MEGPEYHEKVGDKYCSAGVARWKAEYIWTHLAQRVVGVCNWPLPAEIRFGYCYEDYVDGVVPNFRIIINRGGFGFTSRQHALTETTGENKKIWQEKIEETLEEQLTAHWK
ncbi:unnamed protein product [Acanthoscelides obtectus]|uniref:Uncharacterized protein n=1 Tax=Acanthoscelides obtectus TaxID=200917 RepID=A0A9P0K5X8_ACAOB|nr:unnamed protein product [Acanthoscelides obtectus]CAK1631167.1 hypothetical protein AOBTE_LOCUS6792 [Acanthoscelides obtectus]